uniref:Kinase D-interacting substrate of 220 kDa-like SAM domain-containing protein n=1 Tax=Plectus sambesii TaxID=2011161 RepID=A0A914UWI2_9BILA
WLMLGHWVSLIEQWPYRMSWMIDYCDQVPDLPDYCTLAEVYDEVKMRIPKLRTEDPLVDIDRNVQNFELYLKTASSGAEQITVGHLRRFVPCTSNLDPYIRKLISEKRGDSHEYVEVAPAHLSFVKTAPATLTELEMVDTLQPLPIEQVSGPARLLFKNEAIWSTIHVPLPEMSTEDVKQLVDQLDIPPERRDQYALQIQESNLSGLVLSICELSAVRGELKMTLGDWTMFKLLVETLRDFKPRPMAERRRERGLSLLAHNSIDSDRRHSWCPDSPRKPNARSPDPSEISGMLQRMGSRGQRSRTNAQSEVLDEQRWLADQYGRMDTVEFAGDVGISSARNSVCGVDEQRWLADQYGRMDTVEFAGDVGISSARNSVCGSRAPSVRFDMEASDANGTVPVMGSASNLARDLAASQDEALRQRRNNLDEKLVENEDVSSDDSSDSESGSTRDLLAQSLRLPSKTPKTSKLGAVAAIFHSEPRLAEQSSLREVAANDRSEKSQSGRTSGVLKKRSQSEIKPNTEVVRTSKSPRYA